MKKSTAKLGERCPRNSPLVGATAERKVFSGRLLLCPEVKNGGGGEVTVLGPTAESPPLKDRPLAVLSANPNCVPISSAQGREEAKQRASVFTLCDVRARLR